MKNVVIIEDIYEHFQIIGKLICGSDIDVFPKNINSGSELSDFLTPVRAFIDTTDATIREKNVKAFLGCEKIKDVDPVSLFILDYQLLADNNNINCLKFCEYIEDIKNGKIPAIILTGVDLNEIDITGLKNNFVSTYPSSKIEFDRKIDNAGRTWDIEKKNVDQIVLDSSELSTRLKGIIKRSCSSNEDLGRYENT